MQGISHRQKQGVKKAQREPGLFLLPINQNHQG
jgi:hypothetical protein